MVVVVTDGTYGERLTIPSGELNLPRANEAEGQERGREGRREGGKEKEEREWRERRERRKGEVDTGEKKCNLTQPGGEGKKREGGVGMWPLGKRKRKRQERKGKKGREEEEKKREKFKIHTKKD